MASKLTRLLLAVLVVLTCAPPARAAWVLKDKAACPDNNGGNGVTASCSITSTGADLLVVSYSSFSGSAGTLSDSHSITWTCKTLLNTNAYTKQMCYAWQGSTNFATSASHTITIAASSSFAGAVFSAWSGSKTSADPFDAEATATQGTGSPTTGTAGPITPTGGADDLFVTSGVGHGTTEFDAATVASFTLVARQAYSGGVSLGDQQWWAHSTSATSAVWTFTATFFNLDMLAFLPAPGGGGAAKPCTLALLGVGSC